MSTKENWSNRDFVFQKVKENGWNIEKANEIFRGDVEIMIETVKTDSDICLLFGSETLFDNEDFFIKKLENGGKYYGNGLGMRVSDRIQNFLQENMPVEKNVYPHFVETDIKRNKLYVEKLHLLKAERETQELNKISEEANPNPPPMDSNPI